MGSEEIRRVMGLHSSEVARILGSGRRQEVVLTEDMVSLEEESGDTDA